MKIKLPKDRFSTLVRGRTPTLLRDALVMLAAQFLAGSAYAAPPNVVIVFCDDLGYGDLGCYGNSLIRTPNLDRMAAEGTRFTDFYAAQAVCSASRAALLTGCYPNRIGILSALSHESRHGIADSETTIAEVLKSRGYATAIFGKWHLGHHRQFLPLRHGFDEYFGLPYSNDMGPRAVKSAAPPVPLFDGERIVEFSPQMTTLTARYAERAVDFIRRNRDRPFFLYLAHSMPHVPLGVSDRMRGRSRAGLYGDVIEEIDASVGAIMTTLKESRLDENTLVLFASDNGPWLNYGNHAGSSGPLREGKGTSWEGGVRVPCIARWPSQVPAGRVCGDPWMTIDVLPTLAGLAGAALPRLPIDGRDAGELLRGKVGAGSPQPAYYIYWGRELQAVRSGIWKLHFPHEYRTLREKPGHDGSAVKYATGRTGLALYDLSSDIGESTNVADRHPDVVAQIEKLAEAMRERLGDSARKRKGAEVREPGRIAD